jgi:type IV secretory pathway TrbD component
MAKQQAPRRPGAQPTQTPAQSRKAAPAPVRRAEKKDNIFSSGSKEMIFGRQNFVIMGVGLALVLLGLAAMTGGAQFSPHHAGSHPHGGWFCGGDLWYFQKNACLRSDG